MNEQGEALNVLVVDDEENIRIAVERILRRLNCQVFKAANGQEALDLLERQSVSVVLLDLKMPGMDGMEVQKKIRQIDESILIIIITGYATLETAINAMKQGAYDFIPKPFDKDHLRLVAGRALEKVRLSREAARLEEERRRTLFDLSTEQSRIRTIVESLPNGVIVTNNQGRVVLMNQEAQKSLCLSESYGIGGRIEDYVSDGKVCDFIHSQCGGETLDREDIASCEMQVEDGRFFLVRTSPVLGSEGEYLGAVVIFVDISAIKRLDLLKSEFVAKVSHELRSPLSTIHEQMAMVLQDMLEQEQSERDHRILARAQEKTRGLISLIEDLLDLSRLEAGVAYQDWQPVQVEELLSRLVEFSKSRAEDKKQRLKLDLPEEPLPAVKADPKALESVFDNLISNAIKYTPEEGEVAVRVHSDTGQISVEVQDTGFGIDPKEQERIFERFYRVKNERTRSITGTGLGLAIVKGILDDLGGRITLSSEPGRGSCFTVLLPAQPRD